MVDVNVREARVGLNSFSISGLSAIPTAEKQGLLMAGAAFVADRVIQTVTGLDLTSLLAIGTLGYYIFKKYHQDVAVESYYQEIRHARCDPSTLHRIYRESPNIKAMGGFAAINNACATRVFNR